MSPAQPSRYENSSASSPTKTEWNVRSFHLEDDLDAELSTAFKHLDLSLSEAEMDINLKKTHHFYPLVVQLGLEQLESMDVTEVTEYWKKGSE